jgi:hypothetical protein
MVNSGLRKRHVVQSLHEYHARRAARGVEEAHKRNLKVTGHLCSIGFAGDRLGMIISSVAIRRFKIRGR